MRRRVSALTAKESNDVCARLDRRDLIALAAVVGVTWASPAAGQTTAMRKIGALLGIAKDDPQAQPRVGAFLKQLEDLGWVEGRDFAIDVRFGASDPVRMQAEARDLVSAAPDVILSQSNLAVSTLLRETSAIPIVFTVAGEPVASGFIKSLARPGTNATGFTSFEPSIAQKWVQFLKEIAPDVRRVGLVMHPETSANVKFTQAAEAAAVSLGLMPMPIGVHDPAEITRLVGEFSAAPKGGLVVCPNPVTNVHRELLISLAERHRLPAVYAFRYFADQGGLLSYGIDVVDQYRRAAVYVHRILKGEKPADLPSQQPNKFELVINLKAAKSLGLIVPSALQVAADEVIE